MVAVVVDMDEGGGPGYGKVFEIGEELQKGYNTFYQLWYIRENNELVPKVNFFQTELSHMRDSFISQLYDNAQINQNMKVLLYGINKNKDPKI